MESDNRNGFVFYKSFWDAIKNLDEDLRRRVLEAIVVYGVEGAEELGDDPIVNAFVALVKPNIDAYHRKRENGAKGKEYGKLGGRPSSKKEKSVKNEEDNDNEKENPTETPPKPQQNPTETPTKPQQNPNETPNAKNITPGKEQEKEKGKEKEKNSLAKAKLQKKPAEPSQLDDFEKKIIETWGKECCNLQALDLSVSSDRRGVQSIAERASSEEQVRMVLRYVNSKPTTNGESSRFKAQVSWVAKNWDSLVVESAEREHGVAQSGKKKQKELSEEEKRELMEAQAKEEAERQVQLAEEAERAERARRDNEWRAEVYAILESEPEFAGEKDSLKRFRMVNRIVEQVPVGSSREQIVAFLR